MDIEQIERYETLLRLSEDYHYEIQNALKDTVLLILDDMKQRKLNRQEILEDMKRDKDCCPRCGNRIEHQKVTNSCGGSGVSNGVLD